MPSVAQEFAVAEVKQHPQSGIRLTAIVAASSLALLVDGTANASISTGLPYIQGIAATTPDETSWLLTLFNAPYYATILFSPWLYARFGRKPLLLGGLLAFTVCSLALSVTTSFELMLVLRALQGIGLGCVFVPAALLMFTSLSLDALVLAIPGFALLSLGAGTLGTLIGGYYSESFGAGFVYLPSAAATIAATILVWFAAPHLDEPQPALKPDVAGASLALLFFGSAQYLSNEAERRNWFDSPSVGIAIVLLAVSGTALMAWELWFARRPHANFHLFRHYRNLAVGGGVNIILGAVGYSVTLFVAYLQSSIAATATLAGALIALRLCTYVLGIIAAFLLVSRRLVDVRVVVGVAAAATAACLLLIGQSMTTTADAASFISASLIFGFFYSMMAQPVPSLVIGSLPLEQLPAGLAIYKLTSPIGLMAATAAVPTLIDHRAAERITELAADISTSRVAVHDYLLGGGSLKALAQLAAQQAQTLAYHDGMVFLAVLVLGIIPLVFVVAVQPPGPR